VSAQQQFFEALLDPGQAPPAGLSAWNASDPATRFAVYRNNVLVSLIDALADSYPVTQELVGEEFFRAMARLFVRAEPPRSPLLAFYGEALAGFIERFPPAASLPYLADVARLEMLRVRAYHAADAGQLPAGAIAQALADAETLPDLRVGLHPALRLLRSPYAVVSLWAAHQGIAEISAVDPYQPENALLLRPHLDVELIRLDPGAGAFVAQLLNGETLGSSVEQVSLAHGDFDLGGILALLIRARAITSITTAREEHR